MASVNEQLADAGTSHAVDLTHYSNGVVRRMLSLLNRVDSDLMRRLAEALERLPPESFTVERLEQVLYSVRELNAAAYASIGRELPTELRALTEYELGYQAQLFQSVIPPQVLAQVSIATVSAETVYAAAMARPFQGTLLKEALAGLEAGRAKIIRDQIRIGYVENEPIAKIVQRIRGTRAKGYADGLLEAPRRHVETIVRTAVSHTAGFARDRFHEANADIIKATRWHSTIDARTTAEYCVPRDGKQYTLTDHKPIGHKYPWGGGPGRLHWNCRSCSVPLTRSLRELGLDVDDFSPATRASMDGQTPAETDYPTWLRKQGAARQDQVLGPVRGKLFRDGGLSIDKFYNDKGKLLSLQDLAERDAAAFRRAGL